MLRAHVMLPKIREYIRSFIAGYICTHDDLESVIQLSSYPLVVASDEQLTSACAGALQLAVC